MPHRTGDAPPFPELASCWGGSSHDNPTNILQTCDSAMSRQCLTSATKKPCRGLESGCPAGRAACAVRPGDPPWRWEGLVLGQSPGRRNSPAPVCLLTATQHPAFPRGDAGKKRKLRHEKKSGGEGQACAAARGRIGQHSFPHGLAFPLTRTVSRSLTMKLIYCAEIISIAGELI